MVKTISSSEVAKILCQEEMEGDPIRGEFGKLFEEAYQQACYQNRYEGVTPSNIENFIEIVQEYIEDRCELLTEDEIEEAARITRAFHSLGMWGYTPKTEFREVWDGHYIAAKPDLFDRNMGVYYEFKIYAPGEYALAQSKVFSWVVKSKIILVGWDGDEAVVENIDGRSLKFDNIPEDAFQETPAERVSRSSSRAYSPRSYYRDNGFSDLYPDFEPEDMEEFEFY